MHRDPEFWFPAHEPRVGRRGGRPRVHVERLLADYPPPTPQRTLCRIWQGAVDQDGYGIRTGNNLKREKRYIHRWVWEMANGPIPHGLVVRHKCDNRPCFRLSHLELGTVADNNRDARERGHVGIRSMSPSMVIAIWERHEAGETYRAIWETYRDTHSLATIKRAKDFIDEAYQARCPTPLPDEEAQ